MKMKKIWVLLLILVCMLSICPAGKNGTVQAAAKTTKNGLVKKNGKYYFYKKGVAVKNKWKTVTKKNGTKTVYYFGKKGAAYAAQSDGFHKRTVLVKKIGGVKYGFLSSAARVSGIYCDSDCQIYFFGKNGKLNAAKTAKLRELGKEGSDVQTLLDYLGEYSKTRVTDSCYGVGKDIEYYYDNFEVVAFQSAETGEMIVTSYCPR